MKRKWLFAIPFIGLLIVGNSVYSKRDRDLPKIKIEVQPIDTILVDTLIDIDDTFSVINLKKYLEQIKAPHARVIYSIAKHESHFSSNLFRSHNNMFGMKNPKRRPTLSTHKGDGWAKFEHWTQSIDDFILYMKFTGGYEVSEKQFLAKIDSRYANRSGYSITLRKYFSEYESILD
jgi:uncharacterized FlgJ-related protein